MSIEFLPELNGEQLRIEKLNSYIYNLSERLKEQGVVVRDDCRLEMEEYERVLSEREIKRDISYVDEMWEKFNPGLSKQEAKEIKSKSKGEQLELLKTVMFDKFLGSDFIVARSSSYDDIANKVDNVILEKSTGSIVCALDEVGLSSGERYDKKRMEVLQRNVVNGGAKLKYGLKIEKGKVLPEASLKSLPIFYISLPGDLIEETINKLDSNPSKQTQHEKNVFSFFAASLWKQIILLEAMRNNINPDLLKRVSHFGDIIEKFVPKEEAGQRKL